MHERSRLFVRPSENLRSGSITLRGCECSILQNLPLGISFYAPQTRRMPLIPFVRQSPFRTFGQNSQHQTQVESFDEIVEMEIVKKKRDEWHTAAPNEDFHSSKNRCSRVFVSTFHTPNYSIWAKSDEKCLQKVLPKYFSTFQNLRLGSINV